jgi:hypothetical protein
MLFLMISGSWVGDSGMCAALYQLSMEIYYYYYFIAQDSTVQYSTVQRSET